MDSLINEIRETIDKFDGNEGDMRFYVGVLTEKFTAMMNDVIPMKKLIIGERQLKITMENITDPLVRNVIDVSEALEELAASLSRSLRNFNGIDPKSYINTIHVMSERLTALASSLSDTKDPNFVEGSIVPALQETIKLLEKLPSLGISNPLSDNIIRMIVSIEKMIANTAESRNKTANLMYCGDNKAIHTSISALLMVSSAVEKYIESPLHKTNILTAQLISTTRIRIFEAKQVVSNQMKLMKNDFSNATFRYRSLYAILSAEKLSKQLIEHLSDNQAQVSKEENILNYLDTSIKAITTINMIPSNIGLILQNIDLILTYHTKIKPGILEKQLSNIECIIIAETIAVLKEIHFNIQQHQNELDQNFLDSNIIRLVQSQLLKLRGLIFKLKTSLKAIEKCTNDPTCSVLLERLIISLNSTMCDQMPSESIDTSRHLASFIQTQHDLGILINSIYKSMNNPNINSHIRSNMQQSLKISQNSYIEMIKIRRELNETPYDSDTIKQAMIQLTKVHNMLEYFIDYSRQYSEKTLDMELQRCTSVTLRNIKNTIDDLNNAPACIFRVPPSSKDVESLIKIIHELESSYDDNSQMKHSLKKQISKLQNEKLLPSDNFFRIVQRILNKISKIPSSHNQELLSKTINELKLFLNYKKPTLADVKALSLAAIAAYDDFIHNIKSRNDQPCYKSWEVTIQNQINSILTIINNTSSEQFNYKSSLLVKEAFMNIKTQLPYIPNSLRDIIDMQIFENLATKLGKAHAHGNKIINCVRNLPTSSVVKIDIHKFRLIQNDDELDDSFLIWREQVNYLNSIVNECSNMPQIATQIHTQNLLSKIVSTLKNILDMKYSNENEMIKFLGFFKDQMQFMENSINLISPILGSPNLPDICLILSQNAILLHRLLISPHMKENESNAFINEFKICFSSLLNLIPKCNQSVQSHIKDLNTIIFGISNIDTIGLRKRQILCDTLYMHVTTILPKIFNAIDSDEIIDERGFSIVQISNFIENIFGLWFSIEHYFF